jgi:hypothetical protein
MGHVRRDAVTAPIAAAGLIAGYGAAVVSGSRPLGGAVLACLGLACISIWARRDGMRVTLLLTFIALVAFAVSHLLGLLIGAWPAVLLCAAGVAIASWRLSDRRRGAMRSQPGAFAPPTR